MNIDDLDWYGYLDGEYCEYDGVEYAYFYRNGCCFVRVVDYCGIEYKLEDVLTDSEAKEFIVGLIEGVVE